jgi:hypothetical protein
MNSPATTIQSLADRVRQLGQAVEWWNGAMIWALVFAALAAIAVVVTTRVALTRAKQLVDVQDELLRVKDDELKRDLKSKDLQIQEAAQKASEANDRAALNEKEQRA